jgi:hypothetical protein
MGLLSIELVCISLLVDFVDVDFVASLDVLARGAWSKFTGIRPHEPCFNFYRVHFQELIDFVSASTETAEQSNVYSGQEEIQKFF